MRFRVLALVVGLSIILAATQFITSVIVETRSMQAERLNNVLSKTALLARNLEKELGSSDVLQIGNVLQSIRDGKFVKQADILDPGQVALLKGSWNTSTSASGTILVSHMVKGDTISVAEPLVYDGKTIGSLSIQYENPGFVETAIPILKTSFFSLVAVLSLGVMLASILVSHITNPMLRLARSAKDMADGNLDRVVPIEGPNEVRLLSTAFSGMIGKLKENIEQIYELAYVDKTTQLPNREFFRKELTRAIRRAVRYNATGALLFVDLDGFKRVNDTHGHDKGDMILSQFSERLSNVLRAEDLVGFKAVDAMDDEYDKTDSNKNKQMLARLGGDEFTVLLSEIREATDAATVSNRIIEVVSEPFDLDGTKITIGASIGIAIFPQDGSDYQTILKSADMAMYQAKDEGKNTYRYFSAELNSEASRRMEIEQDLRVAIEEGDQLELYYQPKIHCSSALPRSAEALLRWKHPEKGMIQPLDFINVAEDCGLIIPVGKWVLQEACRQIKNLEDKGIEISIAVNISTAQFERPDLSQTVIEVLKETGANPRYLELELTESMSMQNPDIALSHIKALKALGVRFAIDDFGTGYSNLSQLSRLPFDVFKIDRSFVDKLTNREDEHGRIIVRTILGMANSLNYETVAEGVENVSQLEFLMEYGCTYAQGYYFARPMPKDEFVRWYTAWNKQEESVVAGLMRQGMIA